METNQRIFKITNDGIYLNNDDRIPLNKTNIISDDLYISEQRDIYWLVTASNNPDDNSILNVEVVDYHPTKIDSFFRQKVQQEISFLNFRNLNWLEYIGLLVRYKPNQIDKSPFDPETIPRISHRDNQPQSESVKTGNPAPASYARSFKIRKNFDDLEIKDGYAQINHEFEAIGKKITIKISNPALLKQYNFIKPYFIKKLGKKTFIVEGSINIEALKSLEVSASSIEISRIDENFIQSIRESQVKQLSRITDINPGKRLYTIGEALGGSELLMENIFQVDINDIIKVYTRENKNRNAQQLRHLAEIHSAEKEVVRVTLKPHFGFVFFIAGEAKMHYVWELLDSHATYIWSFNYLNNTKEEALEIVEEFVNEIHKYGRNHFKTKAKTELRDGFSVIDHLLDENKNALFEPWRTQLDQIVKI